ncbi:MAG: cysteine synthase A [Bacteroidetes bacterium GWF2_42_66]|nr:MAG: cysteine synthase A [Bacteroidetes bacterium GWA2_42_15]OFX99202.1 MAG: cysteine synthase A [Bacteroidetes bacterium GWE2_42_39]OFY40598.1 MAG: cysteine synthase A [Bacteroidetes bacterium GWF2_42_66]HBL74551.1 cysteine synthase A [Prolixibacteraceae bacterium]HCR89001.1 cysteine synthase A [Prolixibacteraceae bacterium]
MKIAGNITELIGKTPMVKLNRIAGETGANIFVKLESQNPGGSVKDRLAFAMIDVAEKQGLVNIDTVIIEPTSGNTGIGLAMVCAVKGYRLIIVMPESVSVERRILLKAYGAELVLTSASGGMKEAIARAEEIAAENSRSFVPMQFENPANAEMHRKTTALEIWNDTDGTVDVFVAGAGTGGTITGVAEVLKQKKPSVHCVVVEPQNSPVLSGGVAGSHKIQGIGPGFIPKVINTQIYDEVFTVPDDKAFETARLLALQEGILCGISSGANVYAALEIAKRPGFSGKNIVTVICDTGERYLSTTLFNSEPI